MNSECVLVADFEKVCRICMKFPETFLSISSFKIIEMISSCTSVQIWENDELPNQICNTCFLQLQNTITFKQLCEKSDTTFRQIIEQSKVKIENADVKIETYNSDSELLNELSNSSFHLDVKPEENHDSDNELENVTKPEESHDSDHELEKVTKDRYTCEKCDKEFDKVWVLSLHMRRIHKARGKKCSKCSTKSYHPLHLKIHEETHNPVNLTCDVCDKNFSNVYKLGRHKFTHCGRKHHCIRCEKSFKDKWTLKKHIKEMHSRAEKYTACHVCGKSILKKNLSIHMVTHGERDRISCNLCLKTFFHRQSLENHVKRVHENQEPERNYLCNVCGRGVRSFAELRRHLLIHTSERPFACDKCDKTYRRSEALKMHVSRAHLDERNFVCTFCSQAFYDKKILRNHVRRHTGEKPFQCHVCEKAFIQKIALKIHMKVHTNSI